MKIKNIKPVYGGYFKVLEANVETSDNELIKRELFSRESNGNSEDSVCAIVYDIIKKKYIFTKQFRIGLYREDNMEIIEATAGTLKIGENPTECMIREIEEELGYSTDNILKICEFYSSVGCLGEKIHLYQAFVSSKVSDGGGLAEEHEEIEIVEMSIDEMKEYTFLDAKTIIGVQNILSDKRQNIYTILENIGYDEKCNEVKIAIDNGLDPTQAIYKIIQDFYMNLY